MLRNELRVKGDRIGAPELRAKLIELCGGFDFEVRHARMLELSGDQSPPPVLCC
jgi:hypothetical protein